MKSLSLLLSLTSAVSSAVILDPSLLLQPSSELNTNFGSGLGRLSTCPRNPNLSCPGSASVDSCCSNTPGGYFVQTQFWDTDPPTGPIDSWTIHGLWPDHCDGKTYDQCCDSSRFYSSITDILTEAKETELLAYMNDYWIPDAGTHESFWEHEWNKHGTCVSTLDPQCYGDDYVPQQEVVTYFRRVVELFKTLPTFDWLKEAGIMPSADTPYTLAQLQEAAKTYFGHEIVWGCRNGNLNEAWWSYLTKGTIESGTFEPTDLGKSKSSCPSTGIWYLPKSSTRIPPPPPDNPGEPEKPFPPGVPTGKFFINVDLSDNTEKGCLISNGRWLVGGTCAGFYAKPAGDNNFSIKSSKGDCGFGVGGVFSCGAGIAVADFSVDDNGFFSLDGRTQFYAPEVPTGSNQVPVATGKLGVSLKLHWTEVKRLSKCPK